MGCISTAVMSRGRLQGIEGEYYAMVYCDHTCEDSMCVGMKELCGGCNVQAVEWKKRSVCLMGYFR